MLSLRSPRVLRCSACAAVGEVAIARTGLRCSLLCRPRACRSSAGILEELPGAAPVDSGPVSLPAAAHTLHGVR